MKDDTLFLQQQPRLRALAWRLLGTRADAEDAVQDCWLRWRETEGVTRAEAWLVTTCTRLCLDRLRARRRRHYRGEWLPEPQPDEPIDALPETHRADLSYALLHLLEGLSPAERAAWVLAECLEYDHGELANVLAREPAACRQLLSRARRKLAGRDMSQPTRGVAVGFLERFMTALASGNAEALVATLAEDVTLWSDGGGQGRAALKPAHGSRAVSRLLLGISRLHPAARTQVLWVDGAPMIAVLEAGKVSAALIFACTHQATVHSIYFVTNPEKLGAVAAALQCS